jgi:hypothetical protein
MNTIKVIDDQVFVIKTEILRFEGDDMYFAEPTVEKVNFRIEAREGNNHISFGKPMDYHLDEFISLPRDGKPFCLKRGFAPGDERIYLPDMEIRKIASFCKENDAYLAAISGFSVETESSKVEKTYKNLIVGGK